jgi:hypothetical protein
MTYTLLLPGVQGPPKLSCTTAKYAAKVARFWGSRGARLLYTGLTLAVKQAASCHRDGRNICKGLSVVQLQPQATAGSKFRSVSWPVHCLLAKSDGHAQLPASDVSARLLTKNSVL